MTLFAPRSLVPIQPKSEAVESCDHEMFSWWPVLNSMTVLVQRRCVSVAMTNTSEYQL